MKEDALIFYNFQKLRKLQGITLEYYDQNSIYLLFFYRINFSDLFNRNTLLNLSASFSFSIDLLFGLVFLKNIKYFFNYIEVLISSGFKSYFNEKYFIE